MSELNAYSKTFPVGNYCAVEYNPCQWGIITLDGKVVVEVN